MNYEYDLVVRPQPKRFPRRTAAVVLLLLVAALIWSSFPTLPRMYAYQIAREMTRMRLLHQYGEGWEVIPGEAFVVYHDAKDEAAGKLVMETAKAVYQPVVELLQYEPPNTTAIIVHPSRETLAESFGWSTQETAMGVYWAGVIHILSPSSWLSLSDPTRRAQIFLENGPVAHEFAHVVVDYKARGNYPRWFSEGIAQYVEYKFYGVLWKDPTGNLNQNLYTLEELEDFANLPNQNLAYRQALSLTLYLVETQGEEVMPGLLTQLGRGATLDQALKRVAGFDLTELEEKWHDWITENPERWQ